jgi:hypothetical protein
MAKILFLEFMHKRFALRAIAATTKSLGASNFQLRGPYDKESY